MDEHKHHGHDHHHPHQPAEEMDQVAELQEMDAASRSLSQALGVSFAILKVIMVIVIFAFLASGFKTIGPDEEGLVLRFGQPRMVNSAAGNADPYVREAGWIWVWPYPIEELVRIPVKQKVPVPINSFWWFQNADELLDNRSSRPPGPTLDPVMDGYCLVRGESMQDLLGGSTLPTEGMDYNIVHSKWKVEYSISNVRDFFKNVYVQNPKPGEVYYELMTASVTPLLKNIIENAVVEVMAHYSIDEAIQSLDSIPRDVRTQAQQCLNNIHSGIKIVTLSMTQVAVPRQVQPAFSAFISAKQQAQTLVDQANAYAQTKLNETAGAVAKKLVATLDHPSPRDEGLWSQAKGQVRQKITEAQAYRTQVVDMAQADATYFQKLLPQYRERPELVVKSLYIDAIKSILADADEIFLINPKEKGQNRELRINLNRDPNLIKKKAVEANKQATGQ